LALDAVEVQRHGARVKGEGLSGVEMKILDPLRADVQAQRVSRSRKGLRRLIRGQFPDISEDRLSAYVRYLLMGDDSAHAVSFTVSGSDRALCQLIDADRPQCIMEVVGIDGVYGSRVSDSGSRAWINFGEGQTRKPGSHRNQS
jgi:hypothetical protein